MKVSWMGLILKRLSIRNRITFLCREMKARVKNTKKVLASKNYFQIIKLG